MIKYLIALLLCLSLCGIAYADTSEQVLEMRAKEYVKVHPEWQFPKGSGDTCTCRLDTVKSDLKKAGLNDCCYKWLRGGFDNNGVMLQIRYFRYCPVCGKEINVFYMGGCPDSREKELKRAFEKGNDFDGKDN